MQRLMEIITGKIQEVTFKHDAARIIQCALKYGSQEQRDTIALELKGHYAQLSQSQYGRFIVSKIMNFLPQFYGKVKKVMRHRDGSMVLEEAYSQFANATQRTALMEEFYGPEFALFKSNQARSIHDLLAENPEKKPLILKHLRASLDSLLEKGKSNIGPHTLIHRALLDYLTLADSKTSLDMVELLKDHLLAILHTREGARVAQIIILLATPKDRKHIIKSFKGYVPKIAMEQHGHTVLMTVMEAVDDTVLVSKSVLGELVKSGVAATDASEVLTPTDLMRHKYASRVAHFVFSGRSSRHQPAHVVKELKEGDETRALTSKKEDANRRNEILVAMSAVYWSWRRRIVRSLVRSKFGAQVVLDIIRNAEGDKTSLLAAIAKLCDGTVESCSSAHASTVVKPKNHLQRCQKTRQRRRQAKRNRKSRQRDWWCLIVGSKEEGAVEDEKVLTFSTAVAGCVAPNMAYWLNRCAEDLKRTSGTAFVLIALLEKGSKSKGGKRKRDAEEGEKKVGKPGIMVLLEVLEKML
ncbi:armadillo-type protein [Chytridium lagenaria]|nr:armadillo-type protein [Chytridium lagenaria]